ncbi:MAG: RHS repeat domain-containing protein [Planctomycetota bacterium]
MTERYAYTAYGQPTILNASATIIAASAISNRYTYTGREWDATLSLHHFRARWMSPIAGRFLGRDPILLLATPNLYPLVAGQVLIATDPTGRVPMFPACCNWCKSCNGQSLLNQVCRFGGTDEPEIRCTGSMIACPVPLDASGNPQTDPTGKILYNPWTCCRQHTPTNWSPWCTEFSTTNGQVCGFDPFDNDCEEEMAKWIEHAGEPQGSQAHLNCMAWCEKCVASRHSNGPADPVYGHLKQICIDQICGNSFG